MSKVVGTEADWKIYQRGMKKLAEVIRQSEKSWGGSRRG